MFPWENAGGSVVDEQKTIKGPQFAEMVENRALHNWHTG